MFGKIISIEDFTIKIENLSKRVEANLSGAHVVFEDKHKIAAEVTKISKDVIECILVGEFINNKFLSGVSHKPSYNATIRIVNKEEVFELLGEQLVDSKDSLYVGKSVIYEGFNVSANINDLFSNHFAIIGNTGSGKSCTVARILQNIFYKQKYIPINSNIVLFDVYGEYHTALDRINQTPYCRCKTYTTNIHTTTSEIVKIPPYFLEVDDIALLLGIDNPAQLTIIEKALKYVYLFTEEESKVIAYKNNIIAKAVLDILTSGKTSAQIRDQVVAVLSAFRTNDINLDSEIVQPGYTRPLKQCFVIDATGKIRDMELVSSIINSYLMEEYNLELPDGSFRYTLKDLKDAFEFALISEGILNDAVTYSKNNILKSLNSSLKSSFSKNLLYISPS